MIEQAIGLGIVVLASWILIAATCFFADRSARKKMLDKKK